MRFLVDRCAGRRLAEWLRSQGHDVLESRELGEDPGDEALLALAVRDGRILITIDSDFGTLVFLQKAQHAGMVRLPNTPVAERISMMADVLRRHADDLSAQAIITVRGNKIRITQR